MNADEFFIPEKHLDPWDLAHTSWVVGRGSLDEQLLQWIRTGPIQGRTDVEVAIALAGLVNDELIAYGTHSQTSVSDDEIGLAIFALNAVTKRLGLDFKVPFRNFSTFRTYWVRNGGHGSWQARRDILEGLFEPLFAELFVREQHSLDALARPITSHVVLGWPDVDEAIRELRRRFESASTPTDYKDTGHRCVAVLEALSAVVFDPAHLNDGETELPVDKTKSRIGRYVERTYGGTEHAELRGLVTATINFAQRVKHGSGSRRDAGIAADSVILLANLLRRLSEPG